MNRSYSASKAILLLTIFTGADSFRLVGWGPIMILFCVYLCRLVQHDIVTCRAAVRDEDKELCIDTMFLEPFAANTRSHWMFIGEIYFESNDSLPILKARTAACMNDLNFDLFSKALAIRRKHLSGTRR